jgi:hypothetical protein
MGEATSQTIVNSNIDSTGNPVFQNEQVFTNRTFDASHNVLNQMVLTYDSTTINATNLESCQEIRSSDFYPSGVAKYETIVTFSDASESAITGVKTIENDSVTSSGDVLSSTITTYSTATVGVIGGDITIDPTQALTKETITSAATDFDNRGNAINQTIDSYA